MIFAKGLGHESCLHVHSRATTGSERERDSKPMEFEREPKPIGWNIGERRWTVLRLDCQRGLRCSEIIRFIQVGL